MNLSCALSAAGNLPLYSLALANENVRWCCTQIVSTFGLLEMWPVWVHTVIQPWMPKPASLGED